MCRRRKIEHYTNIKYLKNYPIICDNFAKKLHDLLINEPNISNINEFEKSFTESIRKASDEEIPKHTSSLKNYPWTNDEFQKLLKQRQN